MHTHTAYWLRWKGAETWPLNLNTGVWDSPKFPKFISRGQDMPVPPAISAIILHLNMLPPPPRKKLLLRTCPNRMLRRHANTWTNKTFPCPHSDSPTNTSHSHLPTRPKLKQEPRLVSLTLMSLTLMSLTLMSVGVFTPGEDMEERQQLDEQLRAVMDKYKYKRRQMRELQEDLQVSTISALLN